MTPPKGKFPEIYPDFRRDSAARATEPYRLRSALNVSRETS